MHTRRGYVVRLVRIPRTARLCGKSGTNRTHRAPAAAEELSHVVRNAHLIEMHVVQIMNDCTPESACIETQPRFVCFCSNNIAVSI